MLSRARSLARSTPVTRSLSTYFTKDHEWVKVEGDIGTIGITSHAADEMGDVVFVEMPPVGTELATGDSFGVVESVKAVSDVYAPVTGEVVDVNDTLEAEPALVNESAESDAWMVKMKLSDASELDGLMSREAYEELLA
eukprot:PLAT13596.1.p2 GENE.PLAT13596.1~~PLAT13596.1.p2  ORF type:complete len:147 (+),score=41.68 PLAT13596.1:27-443(+)